MKKKKLAKNAKAVTATAGKFALKGLKLAGKGVLTGTELAGKATGAIARNRSGRKLLSKAALIAACVAMPSVAATFATVGLTATALNYMYKNILLGRETSPVEAAENVARSADVVLDKTLAAVSIPVRGISKGVEKISKAGKDALDR